MTTMLWLSAAALIVGLALLALGLRGRRIDDHALCRKCNFDLTGLSASGRCPECGSDLSTPHSTRTGNRRRRRAALIPGLLLTLAALGLGGALGWAKASAFNWNTIKPEWWLASDAHNAATSISDAALAEFASRLSAGKLSAPRATSLANEALSRHADPDSAWSQGWAEYLELASFKNLLSDSQLAAYVRAIPILTMSGRPNAVQGQRWFLQLHVRANRVAVQTRFILARRLLAFSIDGVAQKDTPPGTSLTALSGSGSSGIALPISATPGPHTITARWSLTVQEGYTQTTTPLASWEQEFSIPLDILPPGTSTVTLLHDDTARPAIERCITTRRNSVSGTAGAALTVMGDIYFESPPIPMAFDVFWRYPDGAAPDGLREVLLSTITTTAGGGTFGNMYQGTLPPGFAADHVDIILRPSPAAAAETETLTQIWDGEITLRQVPVQLSIQPTKPIGDK